MIVGFTGTRFGMTDAQLQRLGNLLFISAQRITEGHHGDCVGGDEEFHMLCRVNRIPTHIHPPDRERLRAYCAATKGGRIYPPRPFLVRDKQIVKVSDVLIAAPRTRKAIRRSGSWTTARYAARKQKNLFLILPDGTVLRGETAWQATVCI